jgi:hypothetical protein|tara:strand:+ start:50 stop:826 length:777 start_codon:yes stop_codon:yes gene_type:complete
MRPYEQALLALQKSRTMRDQRGGLGMEGRAGSQNQPFTDINVRQRVPLVGAQRVDEVFAERSDKPQMNRRQAERTAAARDMARSMDSSRDMMEEEMSEEEMQAAFQHEKQRALEGAPKPRTLGDEMSLKSQSSAPFNAAWNLLKSNVYDAAARSNLPPYPASIQGMMARHQMTSEGGPFPEFDPEDVAEEATYASTPKTIQQMREAELMGRLQRQSVPDVRRYLPDTADDREVDDKAYNRLVRESSPKVPLQQYIGRA